MIKKLSILLIIITFCSCSDSGLDNETVIKSISEVWNKGANNQEFLESILKDGNWINKIQESFKPIRLNKITSLKIIDKGKVKDDEQLIYVRTEGSIKLINKKMKDVYVDENFAIVLKYYFKKDSFDKWRCIVLYSEQVGFQVVTGKIESSGYK